MQVSYSLMEINCIDIIGVMLGVQNSPLSHILSSYLNNRTIIFNAKNINIKEMKGSILHELIQKLLYSVRVIIDFIPNHTGKGSMWFQKSQKREGKYADYYIWASCDPLNGTYINNWVTLHFSSFPKVTSFFCHEICCLSDVFL